MGKDDPTTDVKKEKEVFIVEEIIDSRIQRGRKEYLLKLEGYPDSDNTWEPADECGCHALIKAYEIKAMEKKEDEIKAMEKKEDAMKRKKDDGARKGNKIVEDNNQTLQEFGAGLRPERIIGANNSGGELMFLMKWKDSDEMYPVPARLANIRCPQIVIAFYQERIKFRD